MLYACPIQYAMPCLLRKYCLYCSHQCTPQFAAQLFGTWAPTAVPHITQVSTVAQRCIPTTRYCTYPPRYLNLGPDREMVLVKRCAVACYSPQLHCSAWVMVPPGPCPGPGSGCKLHLQKPIYRVHALAPLATQSQLASWPSTRLSYLSLSASYCLCLRPSHLCTCGACTYVPAPRPLALLSTNWHLLGSDRDTKTKFGTNPSISSKLLWSQDRHLNHLHLCSHPGPSSSFFLFVFWKRAPRVSLASTESISPRL